MVDKVTKIGNTVITIVGPGELSAEERERREKTFYEALNYCVKSIQRHEREQNSKDVSM